MMTNEAELIPPTPKDAALGGLPPEIREEVVLEAARHGIRRTDDVGWLVVAALVRSEASARASAEVLVSIEQAAESLADRIGQAVERSAQRAAEMFAQAVEEEVRQVASHLAQGVILAATEQVNQHLEHSRAAVAEIARQAQAAAAAVTEKSIDQRVNQALERKADEAANRWVELASKRMAASAGRANFLAAWAALILVMIVGGVGGWAVAQAWPSIGPAMHRLIGYWVG